MKSYLIIAGILVSLSAHAAEKHEHREHGAHTHGSAELSIAFDSAQGKIEFKSPSDGVIGFEHAIKSASDKRDKDNAFKKLEINISEIISFDKSLKCKILKDKIEIIAESDSHSDTNASFTVNCERSPLGTKIIFYIQKFFPHIKDIDTQIIVDNIQKSAEIKANGTSIELK